MNVDHEAMLREGMRLLQGVAATTDVGTEAECLAFFLGWRNRADELSGAGKMMLMSVWAGYRLRVAIRVHPAIAELYMRAMIQRNTDPVQEFCAFLMVPGRIDSDVSTGVAMLMFISLLTERAEEAADRHPADEFLRRFIELPADRRNAIAAEMGIVIDA